MARAQVILQGLWEASFGDRGTEVEKAFVVASNKVGLTAVTSPHSGKMWDFQAQSGPWNRYFFGKPVNIKNHKGKFLFWSTEVANMLPWDPGNLPPDYDTDKAEREVYQYIQRSRLPEVVFLKPATVEVEDRIIKLADIGADISQVAELFKNKRNWLAHMLGPRFGIHINLNEKKRRVSSVVIVQPNGRVFGMSEKPRGGKVQFRHNRNTRYSSIGYVNLPIMV